MNTIEEARKFIISNMEDGVRCPCCNNYCKLYKRAIHTEVAVFLIKLVRSFSITQDWVHIRDIVKSNTKASTDGSYLPHWGLVIVKDKRLGYYKPTEKGIQFVHKKITVPKYVYLYRNKIIEFSTQRITISQALGTKFSYQDLMNT